MPNCKMSFTTRRHLLLRHFWYKNFYRAVIAKAPVRSQAIRCGTCGGKSSTDTGLKFNNSVFLQCFNLTSSSVFDTTKSYYFTDSDNTHTHTQKRHYQRALYN